MPGLRRMLPTSLVVAFVVGASALGACSSASTATAPSTTAGSNNSPSTGTPTSTVTTAPVTSTTVPPSTTEAPVTTGGIVMVANCSDINGAAGVLTDELAALGFETREATNGAGIDKKLEKSKIYVVKGSEAVARSLSRLMGGVDLYEMTTPAWIKDGTAGLGDATVLVMLGHDLAGKRLAEMAG